MMTKREILITRRTDAGLTQREFADMLEISQPWLARIESGSKDCPQDLFDRAIAELDAYVKPSTEAERERDRARIREILDELHAAGWPA